MAKKYYNMLNVYDFKLSTWSKYEIKMPRLEKELLINWFKKGEKNREDWKIGTEHEKFIFHLDNLERVGYFGKSGISELLNNLAKENK